MTRVWLPHPPELAGPLPEGVLADVWTGDSELPASAGEVELVVVPSGVEGGRLTRVLHGLPRLKVVQLYSAGADHVIPSVPAGVTLCNARGAHTPATAEWAAGAIIAATRQFPRFALAQERGEWAYAQSEAIGGKRVLIVGYGSIGAAVERRLAGWDVTIDRVARGARPGVHPLESLPGLLPDADVVVILVPTVEDTRNMVDAKFLAAMKDGALLVNAARGAIVDTGALLAELTAGRLRAALDVTSPEPLPPGHPLWQAPGLLLTPHVGGAVLESRERAYAVIIPQIARYVAGEPLLNVITDRGY
ncbi:MAG TPA: 2-hydroxyacid dehydrogenase [Trebonia sp.]|nr:2-hydroxyacid dehydrogenase [Trebonia sp.]